MQTTVFACGEPAALKVFAAALVPGEGIVRSHLSEPIPGTHAFAVEHEGPDAVAGLFQRMTAKHRVTLTHATHNLEGCPVVMTATGGRVFHRGHEAVVEFVPTASGFKRAHVRHL